LIVETGLAPVAVGGRYVVYVSGVAALTLVVNATTANKLLRYLRLVIMYTNIYVFNKDATTYETKKIIFHVLDKNEVNAGYKVAHQNVFNCKSIIRISRIIILDTIYIVVLICI
jgi:hypothetical protein